MNSLRMALGFRLERLARLSQTVVTLRPIAVLGFGTVG